MPLNDDIVCTMKVLCSAELDLQKKRKGVAVVTKSIDQCPALQDENITRKLSLSFLKDRFLSCALEVAVSSPFMSCGKVYK